MAARDPDAPPTTRAETATAAAGDESAGPATAAAGAEPVPPSVGRYRLLGQIGAGGMGVVYRARDPALDRDLAIKVVRTRGAGDDAQLRLLREAQAMARLRSPGVVPVFDVGTVGDDVFVVMPLYTGGTLGAWLATSPRPWPAVLDRFVAAGRGLSAAHAAGLVHRDFKPDNVLLDDHGGVHVADFGLARAAGDCRPDATVEVSPAAAIAITRTGAIVGTPAYMSPEQHRGEPLDRRADVFSFCVALYEALYRVRPFAIAAEVAPQARAAALIGAIAAGPREPPGHRPRSPAWLRAAIVRGLAARPDDRWPSIDALLAHLDARRRRPRRVAAIAVGLALTGGTIALTAALAPGRDETTSDPATGRTRPAGDPGAAPAPAGPAPAARRLTTRGDVEVATLSPRGDQVALIADHELSLRSLAGDAAARVLAADAVGSPAPAWSPSGDRIAYVAVPGMRVRVIEVSTGAAIALPLTGVPTFATDHELLVATSVARRLVLRRIDLAHPDAPPRACELAIADRALFGIVAIDAATVLVAAGPRDGGVIDQIVRTDPACAQLDVIASGLSFGAVASGADRGHLIALTAPGPSSAAEIDRDGRVRTLAVAQGGPSALVAGARPDGTVVTVDGERTWRLVRAGPGRTPDELMSGALDAWIDLSPDGRRLAVVESGDDGGPLRIVELATPSRPSPPIEAHALGAAWSPDGERLAATVRRTGFVALVVETRDGRHLAEHPTTDADDVAGPVWIDDDTVAYPRRDGRTYVAIDLRTGDRRALVDPAAGEISSVVRSRRDGRLAFFWARGDGRSGVWTMRPGQPPGRLAPATETLDLSWSWDGDALLAHELGAFAITRISLDGGAATRYLSLPASRLGAIARLLPLPGGDLLAHETTSTFDLFAAAPR